MFGFPRQRRVLHPNVRAPQAICIGRSLRLSGRLGVRRGRLLQQGHRVPGELPNGRPTACVTQNYLCQPIIGGNNACLPSCQVNGNARHLLRVRLQLNLQYLDRRLRGRRCRAGRCRRWPGAMLARQVGMPATAARARLIRASSTAARPRPPTAGPRGPTVGRAQSPVAAATAPPALGAQMFSGDWLDWSHWCGAAEPLTQIDRTAQACRLSIRGVGVTLEHVLRQTSDRRRAETFALGLDAAAIESRLELRDGEWRLLVEEADVIAAIRALDGFDEEIDATAVVPIPLPVEPQSWLGPLVAVALFGGYLFTGPVDAQNRWFGPGAALSAQILGGAGLSDGHRPDAACPFRPRPRERCSRLRAAWRRRSSAWSRRRCASHASGRCCRQLGDGTVVRTGPRLDRGLNRDLRSPGVVDSAGFMEACVALAGLGGPGGEPGAPGHAGIEPRIGRRRPPLWLAFGRRARSIGGPFPTHSFADCAETRHGRADRLDLGGCLGSGSGVTSAQQRWTIRVRFCLSAAPSR